MINPSENSKLIRVLLVLHHDNGASITKRSLSKKLLRKGEKIKEYQATIDQLLSTGAIINSVESQKNFFQITAQGQSQLLAKLYESEFVFEGVVVGSWVANTLLNLMRSHRAPDRLEPTATISSYENFVTLALTTFDQLNSDYNLGNLVPIYRIRRAIGDRVSRSDFNEWLIEMQANDIIQLLEGSVEDSAPDKIEDSITTKVSGLRCYAKRLFGS